MKNKIPVLREDLPIKYSLRLHQFTSAYPTQSDLVFDCVTFYAAKNKKTIPASGSIDISKSDLKEIFTEKLSDIVFVQKLKTVIKQMIEVRKIIKKEDDVLSLTQGSITELYKLS